MGQLYGYLKIGCTAGLAYFAFLDYQAHDLPHAALALGLAVLASR